MRFICITLEECGNTGHSQSPICCAYAATMTNYCEDFGEASRISLLRTALRKNGRGRITKEGPSGIGVNNAMIPIWILTPDVVI